MTRPFFLLMIVFALSIAPACRPELTERTSLIAAPRIIAVRADPPESSPGSAVAYQALVASASPERAGDEALEWAFCTAPKPLTENNVISRACLEGGNAPIEGGAGRMVTASSPPDGCQLFGPDPPPGAFRPRDPDVTGGYYQPLVITRRGETAVALERIRCNLARAPADIAAAYRMRYLPNRNPALLPLHASLLGQQLALDALPRSTPIALEAAWTSESAEVFPVYDPVSRALVDHREALTVSWFATAGGFDAARTGRAEGDLETTTRVTWTTPSDAGAVRVWVVLRDSRGGVDFASYDLTVVR